MSSTKTSSPGLFTKIGDHSEVIAHWTVGIYCLASIAALGTWLFSPLRHNRTSLFWWEYALDYLNLPVNDTLFSVILMLLISRNLLKRRRIALYTVIFFEAAGALLSALYLYQFYWGGGLAGEPVGWHRPLLDIFSIVMGTVACILLICARRAFPAKISRTSWKKAFLVLLLGLTISVALALLLGHIQRTDAPVKGWTAGIGYLLYTLGISNGAVPKHISASWISYFILDISLVITLLATVFTILRTPRDSFRWSPKNELDIRELIHTHGDQDSLSYFATRRDKSVIFSDDGQAAITYRLINSVCLASADPVGAPSSWASAIENWRDYARTYGWNLGAISISDAGAKAFAAAGLSIIYTGDEAILYTDRFSLNNTSLTAVRQATRRLATEDYEVRVRLHRDLTEAEMRQIISETDTWRHGKTERGFSMALNRLGDSADERCVLVSAHAPDGTMVGLLSLVPWGKRGISLDLMRRSPDAPNGTVEFMVAGLMDAAPGLGIKKVSLNFAMFRKTFVNADHFGASPFTRAFASALGFFDRYLQLERLYRFNQKFDPRWEPRYLAAESVFTLVQVGVAAGIAEGFLPTWLTNKVKKVSGLDEQTQQKILELNRRVEAPVVEHHYSQQTRHRIRHLEEVRAAGLDPYPQGISAQYSPAQLANVLAEGNSATLPTQEISLAGRVRFIRSYGSVLFIDLVEGRQKIQVVCERSAITDSIASFDLLRRTLDTGDIVRFTGLLGTSRNGTPSFLASAWQPAAKSLHAIPFGNFTDPEARLRRRSTDLIVNPEQQDYLHIRSSIISSIRATLDADGFTEVETPILNTIHGGASARPFKTFINAYGAELYLRIAPELYLKRLVVGGMGAVYELGRNFRNEGADATHNPEFTVLEAYKPYSDYQGMRLLAESMIKNAARSVFGSESLPLGAKNSTKRVLTDVSGPWLVKTVCGALSEELGIEISLNTDFETLLALARQHEIYVRDDMGPGAIIEELYGELVEAKTTFPTFYTDFPVETSPLAGAHRDKPGLAERWDLVINGMELGTAYSEMADALEQRRRLTEQSLKAAAGDPEAMEVDEDFLYALETGLPPTGGLGIGIDRLVMLMTQTQIRGVLSFPFIKPGR